MAAPRVSRAAEALSEARRRPYWLDVLPTDPAQPALVGSARSDLAVVGGGYSGLWTALLAKQREPDRDVLLLEAKQVGGAASGRNGGFCSSSLTHGLLNGQERFPDELTTLEQLGRDNLDAIEKTVRDYGIDCGWERTGELTVATQPWQMAGLRELTEVAARTGGHLELLDGEQVRRRVDSPTYVGGLLDTDSVAMVDPARLATGLRDACLNAGVRLHEETPVEALRRGADEAVELRTPYGTVTARQVALGTGALSPLLRGLGFRVVPVWDYALVTEPLSVAQREAIGWADCYGMTDAGNLFHYYRLTEDGRILWGGYDAVYRFRGRTDESHSDNAETFLRLAQHFFETFPQLGDVKFSHAWGGVIDTCTRFCPFWGQAFDGRLAYVAGYTGLGVGASRFGAKVMLDLLSGAPSELTALEMVRTKPLPFPPEPLRWAGIMLTRRAVARADANEGRRGPWLRTLDRLGLGFDS